MARSLPPGGSLPSSAKKPAIDPSKGGKRANRPERDGKIDEPDFKQISEQDQELRRLARIKGDEERRIIRQKREKQELSGKTRKIVKVSLSEITTEMAQDQGGLPEHLAALPQNHPLRVRWEKGYRQRADGSWYKPIILEHRKKPFPIKEITIYWVPLILLAAGFLYGFQWYTQRIAEVREEIVEVFKKKALPLRDPEIKEKYQQIYQTNWLPDLERLLKEVGKIPRNFSVFIDNPEKGSYLNYIKKHNKPFNPREAMEWRIRVIRKPHK